MPPKKDDKKKGKDAGAVPTLREIDPAHYLRKATPIAALNPAQQKIYQPFKGKLLTIDQSLPIWPETLLENWGDEVPEESSPEIKYPSYLQFDKYVSAVTYFGLDAGEPVDPKAKGKKDAKKPPAKGKEEVIAEVTETLFNENGIEMPVVYKAQADEWSVYPPLRMSDRSADSDKVGADFLMHDVFAMIARFVPNLSELVTQGSTALLTVEQVHQNYLWRSIYPKLPGSNKPVYNAQGRHVVKLFVSGAWRKVLVTDSIPVQADGRPCLATTTEKLELWPLLLSKALYTAYTALGYTFLELADEIVPLAEKKSLFFTFAMQCLTGWNPHQQRLHWPQMLVNQQSKSVDLLMQMLHKDVPLIREEDVVAEDDCFRFNLPNNSSPSGEDEFKEGTTAGEEEYYEEGADVDQLRTKKRFKEDYKARKAQRDEIVQRILERERRVDAVDSAVKAMRPSEVFYVMRQQDNGGTTSVSAILGMVLPRDVRPLEVADLAKVRLLLHWDRKPKVSVTPNTSDPLILGKGKYAVAEFLQAFPEASPVEYEWCSLGDLIGSSDPLSGSSLVHLISLFTGVQFQHHIEWSRRWIPCSPPAPAADAKDAKGGKPPTKDKSKKMDVGADAAAAAAAANDGVFAEPPTAPPTFLKIDLTSAKQSLAAKSHRGGSALSPEEQEALAMQRDALLSSAAEAETEDAVEIDVTVTIAADLVHLMTSSTAPPSEGELPPVDVDVSDDANHNHNQNGPSEEETPEQQNTPTDSSGRPKLLPSDTVLILQEIVLSSEHPFGQTARRVPRMFVMKLGESASLPMATQLIRLSISSAELHEASALFFWVRLFSRASVSVRFDGNAAMAVDLAETLWMQQQQHEHEAQGGAYEVLIEQGECGACVVGVDQPLLRLPMFSHASNSPSSSSLSSSSSGASHETAMVFLHVSDPGVAAHVDLSYMSLDSEAVTRTGHGHAMEARQFPAIQGVLAPYALVPPDRPMDGPDGTVRTDDGTDGRDDENTVFPTCPVLLATLRNTPDHFHQHAFFGRRPAERAASDPSPPTAELPAFQWKLVVLSRRRLASCAEAYARHPSRRTRLQEAAVSQRFEGFYVPNQAFRLFRDVYVLDKNAFPLSVKMSVAKLPTTTTTTTKKKKPTKKPAAAGSSGSEGNVEEANANGDDNDGDDDNDDDNDDNDDEEAPQFALRFYRKHDDVLLAEHTAHDVLEIQWQDVGLLDDPAHPPPDPVVPIVPTTMATSASAKGKGAAAKPATGKGALSSGDAAAASVASGPPVEVILECVLLLPPPELDPFGYDRLYRKYFSRYPHVFDAFFSSSSIAPGDTPPPSASTGASEEEGGWLGGALHKDTMSLQDTFLRPTPIHEQPNQVSGPAASTSSTSRPLTASFRTLPGQIYRPPDAPLLHWRLDWQAGRVLSASHDTTLLMKFQAIKQSWDALPEIFTADGAGQMNNTNANANGGGSRYERAQAALQFLRASSSASSTTNVAAVAAGSIGGTGNSAMSASASNKSLPTSRPATAAGTTTGTLVAPKEHEVAAAAATGLSQASLEQLVTALNAPGGVEEMQRRYAAVLSSHGNENGRHNNHNDSSSNGNGHSSSSSSSGGSSSRNNRRVEVGNAEIVESRYMQEVESLIAPNRSAEDVAALGSEAWQELVRRRRESDAAQREAHFQRLVRFVDETLTVQFFQQECVSRVQLVQRRLQEQRREQVAIWDEREKVRRDYESKNQALYALLRRAKDAKANALAAEAAAEAERLKQEAKSNKGKKK
jgi:hypothetical protein